MRKHRLFLPRTGRKCKCRRSIKRETSQAHANRDGQRSRRQSVPQQRRRNEKETLNLNRFGFFIQFGLSTIFRPWPCIDFEIDSSPIIFSDKLFTGEVWSKNKKKLLIVEGYLFFKWYTDSQTSVACMKGNRPRATTANVIFVLFWRVFWMSVLSKSLRGWQLNADVVMLTMLTKLFCNQQQRFLNQWWRRMYWKRVRDNKNCNSFVKGPELHLNAIFPPLDVALMKISRSRFKESKNPYIILWICVVLWIFGWFLGIFGRSSFSRKIGKVKRNKKYWRFSEVLKLEFVVNN